MLKTFKSIKCPVSGVLVGDMLYYIYLILYTYIYIIISYTLCSFAAGSVGPVWAMKSTLKGIIRIVSM